MTRQTQTPTKPPTKTPRRRRNQAPPPKKRRGLFAALGWLLLLTLGAVIRLAYDILRIALLAIAGATAFVTRSTGKGWKGGRRHFWRPVLLSTILWLPVPGAWEFWAVLSVLVFAWSGQRVLAHRRAVRAGKVERGSRRKYLSTYELWLVGGASLYLSVWHHWTSVADPDSVVDGVVLGAVYTVGVASFTFKWWASRRVRPTAPSEIDEFLQRWANSVAEVEGLTPRGPDGKPAPVDPETGTVSSLSVPMLAGSWSTFEKRSDEVWVGVVDLTNAKASDAARLDEDVERALNLRRGSVTLGADPKLTVRQLRATVVLNPDALSSKLNYWDGPSLDQNGRFVQARTKDQRPVYAALRNRRTGSAYMAGFAAPSGSGKGGAIRIAAVEAALDPDTLSIIIDGKGGAGVPYLKAGSFLYVYDKALFVPVILAFESAMEERKAQHGRQGLDSFLPRPGEPQCILIIDELSNGVLKYFRKEVVPVLKNIAGTGRSVGYSLWASMQKGDGQSWGDTEVRSNAMDNGWMWLGPSTDVTTKNTSYQSLQSQYGIDPSQLPEDGGWCFVAGRVLGAGGVEPSRGLWLPNRLDVQRGHEAPFGTCEDVLEQGNVNPEWNERVVFETALAVNTLHIAVSGPEPVPTAARGPFAVPDVMAPSGDRPARPAVVEPGKQAPTENQAQYLKVVAAAGEALSTREVARRVGAKPATANDNLQALAKKGWIKQTNEGWVEA